MYKHLILNLSSRSNYALLLSEYKIGLPSNNTSEQLILPTCKSWVALHLASTFFSKHFFRKSLKSDDLHKNQTGSGFYLALTWDQCSETSFAFTCTYTTTPCPTDLEKQKDNEGVKRPAWHLSLKCSSIYGRVDFWLWIYNTTHLLYPQLNHRRILQQPNS